MDALIAMQLVKNLHIRSSLGWYLSNYCVLLREQLFVYCDLWKWIKQSFQAPGYVLTGQVNYGSNYGTYLNTQGCCAFWFPRQLYAHRPVHRLHSEFHRQNLVSCL